MMKETFQNLVKRMKGMDTIHGWDVLVTYDVDKINKLLKVNKIEALEDLSNFGGDCEIEDENGNKSPRTYDFNVVLETPILEFQSVFGKAKLTADLKGTYQAVAPTLGKKSSIKDGLKLQFEVDLANVKGTYSQTNGKTTFSKDTSSAEFQSVPVNYVVELPKIKDSARGICLSFNDAKPTILGSSTAKLSANVNEAFFDGLKKKAQASSYSEHFIAGVTPYMADPAMVVLQPVSFCFSVQQEDVQKKLPGALLMWIAVKGGYNNGKRESGTTELRFEPDGNAASPIPDGSSASIIFAHDLMANAFFKPSLQTDFSDIKVKSSKGEAGMLLEGSLKSGEVMIEKFQASQDSGLYRSQTWYCDRISFPTSSPPTTITVNPGIVTADSTSVDIEFTSNRISAHWSTLTDDNGEESILRGNIEGTFKWGAKGSWSGGNQTHRNVLQLKFKKDEHWTKNTHSKDPSWLDQFFAGEINEIPNFVGTAEPPNLEPDLNIGALDYFLITNLLFPGQHVFHADSPVSATKEKTTGLAVPRDFILTGKVMELVSEIRSL